MTVQLEQTNASGARQDKPSGNALRIRRRLALSSIALVLAVAVVLTVVATAVAPDAFAPGDPVAGVPSERLQPPSSAYPFGTDQIGRDIFTRVVHGSQRTVLGAVIAILPGFLIGATLGVVAAMSRRRVDDFLMRVVDAQMSIPWLLLALLVIAVFGPGTVTAALAVSIGTIGGFARVTRAEATKVRHAEFVEASTLAGASWARTVITHVLPNSIRPVLALATVYTGSVILWISGLSFLGYGTPPPLPEWGAMVADGRNFLHAAWWIGFFPGLAIFALAISVNVIGQRLRIRSTR